jgi:hypothetical protein
LNKPFTSSQFRDKVRSLTSRGPSFVGIGTPKSGTTWWYQLLLRHPSVAENRLGEKELAYFYHFSFHRLTYEQIETYREAFGCPPSKISGEWSPSYMYYPGALEALAATVPETKILVLLRNPIDRYLSHINQFRRSHGRMLSNRDLQQLVNKYWGIPDAAGQSLYGTGVSKALEYFGAEHILFLQYEKCSQSPLPEFQRTCRFLGIPALDRVGNLAAFVNPSIYDIPRLMPAERRIMANYFRNDVLSIAKYTDDIDIELWPDFLE